MTISIVRIIARRYRDDYYRCRNRYAREMEEWAHEHDLTYFDERSISDLWIEYDGIDGRREREDVEVVTIRYRARRFYSTVWVHLLPGSGARISGRGGGRFHW
jgi:hypothetical protein